MTAPQPFEAVPEELRRVPQWIAYVLYEHPSEDKPRKIPINPHKLTNGSTTNPKTWSAFEVAVATIGKTATVNVARKGEPRDVRELPVVGPGFVFTKDDPYCGVDLDGCVVDGAATSEAFAIVRDLDSYSELSPSGTGVHVIVKATKPRGRCRRGGVEVYDHGRYFTVTGNREALWPKIPTTVEERQEQLEAVWRSAVATNGNGTLPAPAPAPESRAAPERPLADSGEVGREFDRELLLRFLELDDDFRRRWTTPGSKDDPKDASAGDHKIACWGVRQDLDDQQLADLIATYRRKHGDAKGKAADRDYLARTIAAARETVSRGHEDDKPLPETREGTVRELGRVLSVPVLDVLKFGVEATDPFRVQTPHGWAELRKVTNPRDCEVPFAHLGYPLRHFKPIDWKQQVVPLICKAARVVETTTQSEEASGWVLSLARDSSLPLDYELTPARLAEHGQRAELFRLFAGEADAAAIHAGEALARYDTAGRLVVKNTSFASYCNLRTGASVTTKRTAGLLRELGFDKVPVQGRTRGGGSPAKIALFVSRPGFYDPSDLDEPRT